MYKVRILLVSAVIPFFLLGQGEIDEQGRKQGKWKIVNELDVECTLIYKDNKRDGACSCYYPDGVILVKGNYVNDLLEGKLIEYYSDGSIYKEDNYSGGNLHGEQKVFNKDKKIIYLANYQQGVLDGLEKIYTKSGRLKVESLYKEGVIKVTTFYRRDGTIKKVKKN